MSYLKYRGKLCIFGKGGKMKTITNKNLEAVERERERERVCFKR